MRYCRLTLTAVECALVLGVVSLLVLPELPTIVTRIALLVLLIGLACYFHPFTQWLAVLLFGFLWATSVADYAIKQIERYSFKTLSVTGVVSSADINQTGIKRILFNVVNVNGKKLSLWQSFYITLYWDEHETKIGAGQNWQLEIATRPVHGRLNEGNFDKQRWAIANHQGIEGKVLKSRLISADKNIRQRIISRTLMVIEHYQYADILLALTFGERGRISPHNKALLINTGTAHLMAISGLHIALSGLIGWVVARGLQFLLPTYYIGIGFPIIANLLVALGYVWLSGANPPAMRALFALFIWNYLRWKNRLWPSWSIWLSVLTLLLITDPLIVLSDSLWLSCFAVLSLLFLYHWLPLRIRKLNKIGLFFVQSLYIQVGILLLLIPLQILLFHGVSISSIITNLFAVPIISFITLPLIFLALIVVPFNSDQPFWLLAEWSLKIVFKGLNYFSVGWVYVTTHLFLLSFFGIITVILLRLAFWRNYSITLCLLFLLLWLPDWSTENSKWRVDMLDIGHGLAIILQKEGHAIIYDTAVRWEGGSMAELTILPFLHWYGLQLDGIIISHQDNDHTGGLVPLQTAYPNSWLRTSSFDGQSCIYGNSWQWRGLMFEVLWPLKHVIHAGNRDSCVIRVSDGRFSILLTGDLEKAQEYELVRLMREKLSTTILQVPHHGSNTSSSALWLRTVKPLLAISSNSRFNRWRLPANQVKKRYQQHNINWYSTARWGQISLLFYDNHYPVKLFRQSHRRWYHDWINDGDKKTE